MPSVKEDFEAVEKMFMRHVAVAMLRGGPEDWQELFSRWQSLDRKVREEFRKAEPFLRQNGIAPPSVKKGRPRADVDLVKLRERHAELLVELREHNSVPYRDRRFGNAGYQCIVIEGLMKEFSISRAKVYRLLKGLR